MSITRTSSNGLMDDIVGRTTSMPNYLENGNSDPIFQVKQSSEILFDVEIHRANRLLLNKTIIICERYRIEFAKLSTIQRKFLTHYRCSMCGLLPLYHINLLHVKRVRCRKCGQLIGFTRKGKYGKLRKEIAFELLKEFEGDV